jgi:hypothetical protein
VNAQRRVKRVARPASPLKTDQISERPRLTPRQQSNEITAIPLLLDRLALTGALVTLDAMGCQTKIAQKILDKGADYLLAIKENWPSLHGEIERYFEAPDPAMLDRFETVDGDHGRIEQRRHFVAREIDWLTTDRRFPGEPRFPGYPSSVSMTPFKRFPCRPPRLAVGRAIGRLALLADAVVDAVFLAVQAMLLDARDTAAVVVRVAALLPADVAVGHVQPMGLARADLAVGPFGVDTGVLGGETAVDLGSRRMGLVEGALGGGRAAERNDRAQGDHQQFTGIHVGSSLFKRRSTIAGVEVGFRSPPLNAPGTPNS